LGAVGKIAPVGQKCVPDLNSKEFRDLITKSGFRRKFPAEAAVCLSFTCLSVAIGLSRALWYTLKSWFDSRTFGWTSTAKGAFMLASLVA
jgi:hypothetical protein